MNQASFQKIDAAYWTHFDERGERLVIPLRRGWKAAAGAFLAFAAFAIERAIHFSWPPEGMDWLWIATAAVMLVVLLFNVLVNMTAREEIVIEPGELVVRWALLGLHRELRYKIPEIRGLTTDREARRTKDDKLVSLFSDFGKVGRITFDYRGETVGLGIALNAEQAGSVLQWMARRLPRSALEP